MRFTVGAGHLCTHAQRTRNATIKTSSDSRVPFLSLRRLSWWSPTVGFPQNAAMAAPQPAPAAGESDGSASGFGTSGTLVDMCSTPRMSMVTSRWRCFGSVAATLDAWTGVDGSAWLFSRWFRFLAFLSTLVAQGGSQILGTGRPRLGTPCSLLGCPTWCWVWLWCVCGARGRGTVFSHSWTS